MNKKTENPEHVKGKTKVLYGIAEFGISMMTSALQFFQVFFYTDVVHYDPALVGTALLVGKLTWDAFNDPLFGWLSDRFKSRWGRRRPFMLLGAIPLGLSYWLLFSVPEGLTGIKAFLVVIATFWLFDTFHTFVSVPYFSLTPELTFDYDERTSLTAVRKIFGVSGYLMGAVATTVVANMIMDTRQVTEKVSWSYMGAIFGVIGMLVILVTAFFIRERNLKVFEPSKMPAFKSFVQTLKNAPFRRLSIAFVLSSFSFSVITGSFAYFMEYQMQMADQLSFVLLALMLTLMLFLYFWKWVSTRINKGPSYALGLLIASLALIAAFFFPPGSNMLIYVVAVVVGFGFSAQYIFPWSMLADVIEVDQAVTGEHRAGIYHGAWAFLQKFTNALGVATIGWILTFFGYVANEPQTDLSRLGIRLLFSIIGSVVMIISLPLLAWFPITKKSHTALLEGMKKEDQAGS
jgi:glycoside/pentoside/hexuronide:cation symporter, GPH family